MNRWDEIQVKARQVVAPYVTPDELPYMANDLIELIGLMIDAVGKGVAISGETGITEAGDDEVESEKQHTIYVTGEEIQRQATHVVEKVKTTDLERWNR